MTLASLVVGASVWVVQRFGPEAAGSGIPDVEAVLHHGRAMVWYRVLWVKFVAACWASAAAWPWDVKARRCKWSGPRPGPGAFEDSEAGNCELIAVGAGAGVWQGRLTRPFAPA